FNSLQLLNDILEKPNDWMDHVQRYTASVPTALLYYGWRTAKTAPRYVSDLLTWAEITSAAFNFNIIDFYSFLRPNIKSCPHGFFPASTSFLRYKGCKFASSITLSTEPKARWSPEDWSVHLPACNL
ncbi:hypothetical protein F5883DRAFT_412637, partial [Diaporthe sp. PMI_573]